MDKKNTILGVVCIGAGIGFMFWQAKTLEEQQRQALLEQPVAEETAESTTPEDAVIQAVETTSSKDANSSEMLDMLSSDVESQADSLVAPVAEEALFTLSNPYVEVEFTNLGGAIRQVSFLQTKRGERDPYIFNETGLLPALSLSLAGKDGALREFAIPYAIEKSSESSVTFLLETPDGLRIRREYTLSDGAEGHDPYVIKHRTEFQNAGATPKALSTIFFNLGTSRPISENSQPNYLNVGYFDGDDAEFTDIRKLNGGNGVLGIGARAPKDAIELSADIQWSSVKNQFFAAVLSSESQASSLQVYPVAPATMESGETSLKGITGSIGYDLGLVNAGAQQALDFDFYVGPKEFKRLQDLGNEQDRVMQFGFFSFFSKLLLSLMYAIHSVVPSWGWSIVILTIIVKTLFWPLTAKASRSQKRMAQIQGPMAELKEKYKDNPQRMQQETIKLFKEHQVNPVAGCLPMFIQMPIFLGLFYMLRTASELRFEPFLWVADLSQPDTIATVAGFPINLLPMIMGLTMFLQMSMMPTSPTADPVQQKIFKFLPFIFLIFLYNFASGLVVYWTMQNILTIIQQKIINSRPDEPLKPAAADGAPLKKAKAVGPMAKGKSKKK